jgi:signal transduction histidine kinase
VQRLIVEGFRSCLQVPLNVQDELLGVVNLAAKLPSAFDSERVEVAVEVANLLAVALQQANLFEQISTARERLEALSRQLLTAQEAERRHIARELHDEIGQSLSMVKIDLQTLQKLPQAATLASHLSDSVEIVERALQLVRDLSVELRPSLLDDLGLVPALRWFLDRLAQRGGFTARLLDPPLEARLAPELEIACYRIAQEALTNILRYAQAKQVEVELQQREAELRLTIRDDGLGFDVSEALKRAMHGTSLGLLSLFSTPPIGLKQ